MKPQAYPAAHAVSSSVEAYFARHRAGRNREERIASVPDAATIETIIGAAFWTSLRREEGYLPRISFAFLSPEEAVDPLVFERPLALDPDALARVAPAVDRPGIHLGVWPDRNELQVWGTTHTIPTLCFVLEVAAPGLLVIKHHRGEESCKYVNVAVLEGDRVKIVDEHASSLPEAWVDSLNVLTQLAVSMRAHGRGGSLLIVPANTEVWRESIVHPIPYAASPPLSELARLSVDGKSGTRPRRWREGFDRAVATIAGLTAVDGAALLTTTYELLGFGAKITRRKGHALVEQITVTEPIQDGMAQLVHPDKLGGTRHLSAAQFAQDQPDAVALVASQDGRFTVFAWSPAEAMVNAHRVETLLR